MDPNTPCPTAAALQQLMLGLGDVMVGPDLEEHLASCPVCVEVAGRTPADDGVVQAVRRAGRGTDTPVPEVVKSLSVVFRRMSPGATNTLSHGAETSAFLEPAQDAGEVGRLGSFVIQERLGAGGMGVVYRGFDPRLQRAVAVKVVRRELLAAPGAVDRFLAEARAAAAVEHDNIVVVHAVEVHDDVPCLVMPLLKGETLERRLRTSPGPLPLKELLRISGEVAAGLAAAHARGLIHRDIKPGNIWLEAPDGRVKILDFGLAIAAEAGGAAGVAGTPGYMAPEQVRGHGVDARADVFGLGCVLYRAATGTAAFDADTPTGSLVRLLTRDPDPVATANPELLPELAKLIDRMVARKPDDRPESAAVVVAEIEGIVAELAARRSRLTRRRWLAAVGAAGVLGAVGVWLGQPKPAPPVRVELLADADVGRVVFTRDEVERVFDLRADAAALLPPGDYRVRPDVPVAGRRIVPDVVTVGAGEPVVVKFALVGEMDRFNGHSEAVVGVAAVPAEGKFAVLSAGRDRTLNAWTAGADGARFERLSSPARCFAATPDGRFAVTAGGNKSDALEFGVQLWNGVALESRGLPLEGHDRMVSAVAVSPDGSKVLSASRGDIRVWDVSTRRHQPLAGNDAAVFAAALDATGRRALTGDAAGRVVMWDAVEGKVTKSLIAQSAGEVGAVRAVAFTPSGFVSAGDDGVVRVWTGTPATARVIAAGDKPILSLAVSRDGRRMLTGGGDKLVKLWSVPDARLVYEFGGHTGAVNGVAFTPDGRGAVSGGDDRTVRLWRLPFD